METIGADVGLHSDFGTVGAPIGIPFVTVPPSQPRRVALDFVWWDKSDPGPYPIPPDAPLEGGASRRRCRRQLGKETVRWLEYKVREAVLAKSSEGGSEAGT